MTPDEQKLLLQFVLPNAALWLKTQTKEREKVNQTPSAIKCYGNQVGFLSLAAMLLVARNELIESFDLFSLGFVASDDFEHFLIETALLGYRKLASRNLVEPIDGGFSWKLGGKSACEFAADIHALGYSIGTSHRHLDSADYPHFTCNPEWSMHCELVTANELIWAAAEGNVEFVSLCMRLRIGVDDTEDAGDLQERSGRTALTAAAEKGHAEIVQLLVDHGANTRKADGYGRTASQVAADNGHQDIERMLIESPKG